jgi:hypothetical protein
VIWRTFSYITAHSYSKIFFIGKPSSMARNARWAEVTVKRRLTPHPIETYETPLRLANPAIGNGRPCTYVAFTQPAFPGPEPSQRWARAQQGSWMELPSGHDAPITVPDQVAELLSGIG